MNNFDHLNNPSHSQPDFVNMQYQTHNDITQKPQKKTNFRIVIRTRPFLSEDSKVAGNEP